MTFFFGGGGGGEGEGMFGCLTFLCLNWRSSMLKKIIFRVKKGNLLDFFRLFLSLLVSFVTRFVEVLVILQTLNILWKLIIYNYIPSFILDH